MSETTQVGPLSGYRIGVTASRKLEEQLDLLRRRGAEVEAAPTLADDPNRIDPDQLRADTERVVAGPVDIFVANTGVGIRSWFSAAEEWGLQDQLIARLSGAEILARGSKAAGALRTSGLREQWVPTSERFADVLAHLQDRDLGGLRIVVQEHGQDLSVGAHDLSDLGAEIQIVTVYRTRPPADPQRVSRLVDSIIARRLDAVTFTSAPAVSSLIEAAARTGRRDELLAAFRTDLMAMCVGPVTGAAFDQWEVPTVQPERARLAAMIRTLEVELPSRRSGVPWATIDGHSGPPGELR